MQAIRKPRLHQTVITEQTPKDSVKYYPEAVTQIYRTDCCGKATCYQEMLFVQRMAERNMFHVLAVDINWNPEGCDHVLNMLLGFLSAFNVAMYSSISPES